MILISVEYIASHFDSGKHILIEMKSAIRTQCECIIEMIGNR